MICGLGVDLVEIERVARLVARHHGLFRVFGEKERSFLARRQSAASYAANFCAKEAFAKALGTGVRGFSLCEVEILRDEWGKPYYALSGRAASLAAEKKLRFSVSLSHDRTHAVAFAVAEKEEIR